MQNPELSESEVEQRLFELINQHRASLGKPRLEWNEVISNECRIHSESMASGEVAVGHDGFGSRVSNIRKVIPLVNAGENIGYISGYTNPAMAIYNEWLTSAGHIKNIEGNYDLTGIGVARNNIGEYYITEIFVKREN
jgi:uncharacterized protein YkwD